MINPIDLNSIDTPENISPVLLPDDFISYEELEACEQPIKQQYIDLENLGVNLLKNVEDNKIKNKILQNMLDYVNDYYISIIDYDASSILPEKLMQTGRLVYEFLCVECYNIVIPRFLSTYGYYSIEGFDFLIKNKFKSDYNLVKASLIKIIKNIIDELTKLQHIDKTIQNDKQYNFLLFKFAYYIELIDFGDTEKFINNYMYPLLIKNMDSILWRI